jgi:outer membrane protein OmpA-like peptidoglycan-associated protein
MPDEKAPTDWAADVKRYVPDADDGVIKKIVSYCGIALRTRDASMVSFTDAKETDWVRENYCKKKLGLEDSDEVLDAAIAAVGERMSDTNYRNRVTVYFLLAEHFGKLSVFGGAAGAATTAAPLAAAAPIAANDPPVPPAAAPATEPAAPVAPVVAAPADPAPPAAPVAPQAFVTGTAAGAGHAAVGAGSGAGGGGFIGLGAVMFGGAATIMLVSAIAGSYIAGRFDKDVPPPAAPAAPAAPVAAAAPVAVPEGAGVISEVVEGRPKVSVYFAVGKNDIAPEFTAALAPVTAWLEANPADRVRLSGFTDPTGDAAANAALAKNRAQAVEAALTAEGVAADRIDLVKPDDTSDEASDLAGARRVEISVTPG